MLNPRDYGVVPDTGENQLAGMERLLTAVERAGPGTKIVFEPGTYKWGAKDGRDYPLVLRGGRGLTWCGVAGRTRFVVTNPRHAFLHVEGGTSVTLRDFTVDYDPVPFTQGRIVAVDKLDHSFSFEPEAGFPQLDDPMFGRTNEAHTRWGMIFDTARRRLKTGAPDSVYIENWKREGTGAGKTRWRMQLEPFHHSNIDAFSAGDRWVQLARRSYGTLLLRNCAGSRLENITVHASPGLAILIVGCRDSVVRNCGPAYAEDSARLITCDSDGIHVPDHTGGLRIENCRVEGQADDGINIHNRPGLVLESTSATYARVTQPTPGSGDPPRFGVGDRVLAVDTRLGLELGTTTLVRVDADATSYSAPLELIFATPITGMTPPDNPQQPAAGCVALFNMDRCGAGFVIRNNHLGPNRRYGMFISSCQGLIENNLLEANSGFGIVLGYESSWWIQGPPPVGLTVRNNRVLGVGYSGSYGESSEAGSIKIGTMASHSRMTGTRLARRIRLEHNEIENPPVTGVVAVSAEELLVKGNIVRSLAGNRMARRDGMIKLLNCKHVRLEGNTFEAMTTETTAAIVVDAISSATLRLEGNVPAMSWDGGGRPLLLNAESTLSH